MDFITNLPNSRGHTKIWVIMDRFTKFAHLWDYLLSFQHRSWLQDSQLKFADFMACLNPLSVTETAFS